MAVVNTINVQGEDFTIQDTAATEKLTFLRNGRRGQLAASDGRGGIIWANSSELSTQIDLSKLNLAVVATAAEASAILGGVQ